MIETESWVKEEGLALVGEFRTIQEVNEYALVILAMNLDCWVRMEAGGGHYELFADPAFALAIREEFALYAAEQEAVQQRREEPPVYKSGIELALLWALVLIFVFANQNEDPTIAPRFCSSSVGLIDGGEWWRPFTSLFLHGDLGHLLGNVLLGGIFCVMVAHTMGPLLGWILILGSGVLGNIATSWIYYPEEFLALGASTATFGALGILVGSSTVLAWRARSFRRLSAPVVPIIAGVILLGWWGAGGPETDVLGHACGFVAGTLLGFLAILLRSVRRVAGAG